MGGILKMAAVGAGVVFGAGVIAPKIPFPASVVKYGPAITGGALLVVAHKLKLV